MTYSPHAHVQRTRGGKAAGLQVYPPGAYGALFVKLPVTVCTRVASMSVTPVRSGS